MGTTEYILVVFSSLKPGFHDINRIHIEDRKKVKGIYFYHRHVIIEVWIGERVSPSKTKEIPIDELVRGYHQVKQKKSLKKNFLCKDFFYTGEYYDKAR